MRRQDGGVPSQWRRSIGSATRGGRATRWEFHFLAGGQDTQDTQDTQDGGKVGLRASERLAGQGNGLRASERLAGQEMACALVKGLRASERLAR